MKRGTPEHPKMRVLTDKLAVPKYIGCGILELLWHMTARFAPRGDIGRFTDTSIADQLEWKKDPGVLITALVDSGWLDLSPKHRLLVHHWPDHCDQSVKKWIERNKLIFAQNDVDIHKKGVDSQMDIHEKGMDIQMDRQKPEKGMDIHEKGMDIHEKGVDIQMDRHNYPAKAIAIAKATALRGYPSGYPPGEAERVDESKDKKKEPANKLGDSTDGAPVPGGADGGDLDAAARRAIEGDAAHKVLKGRPELSGLTYEQDVTARKDWACFEPRPNWVEVAEWVCKRAVLAGNINEAGTWLAAQYWRWFDDLQKKNTWERRQASPLKRMFKFLK